MLQLSAVVVMFVIAIVLPLLLGAKPYILLQWQGILVLVVVGLGLNIAYGMAGQFLLGIIAVFAASGLGVAWAATQFPEIMSLPLMCLVGALLGTVTGLILAMPSLRVSHFYLGLVTLYAAVVVPSIARNTEALGGEAGILLFTVPGFSANLEGYPLYVVLILIVAAVVLFTVLLRRSTVGRRFLALSSSDQLAASIGISPHRTKALAIAVASTVAGVAGGLYVYSQQFFGHSVADAHDAILLLAAMMIGGFRTITGTLIGVVAVFAFDTFVTDLEQYTGIIFGIFLLLCTLYFPNGLVDKVKPVVRRFWRPGPSSATASPQPADNAPVDIPLPSQENREQLSIVGATRYFGGVKAVDGVDLEVEPGTIHGLIGSNGSGKTTLLNLISGYYSLSAGTISIGHERISGRSVDTIARAGIARTFQTPKLMVLESVLDNVLVAADQSINVTGLESVLMLPRGERTRRAAESVASDALARLTLSHLIDEEADSLPHGTRRLVEIARAIALRPKFVLLDEPAAGLSPAEVEVLADSVQALAASGVGVLLIEHNVPLVLELADRVTVMHQGKPMFQGTADELRADAGVAKAFLGIDVEMEGTK
ncbi:branched-chain amino acid ABC transporter ATP-binding protein/permease [Microbacterium sp. A588]